MGRVVIIDTETGGLDPQRHSLISVAMVLLDDDLNITGQREWLVLEDPLHICKAAWQTNQLDLQEYYAKAQSPYRVITEVNEFIDDYRTEKGRAVPGGHNVTFDMRFLKRMALLSSNQQAHAEWVDKTFTYHSFDTHQAVRLYSMVCGLDEPLTSLGHCCEHFGIEIGNAHRALDDAVATAKLTRILVDRLRALGSSRDEPEDKGIFDD